MYMAKRHAPQFAELIHGRPSQNLISESKTAGLVVVLTRLGFGKGSWAQSQIISLTAPGLVFLFQKDFAR